MMDEEQLQEVVRRVTKAMGKKRNRGEGTLYLNKAKGLWTAEVTIGYANGKRIYKSFSSKDKAKALAQLKQLQSDHLSGTLVAPSDLKLGQLLKEWLTAKNASGQIRKKTHQLYGDVIKNHLVPHFGDVKVQAIVARTVQSFYSTLEKAGKSARVREECHKILTQAFKTAQAWGLVRANPMFGVVKPKAKRKPIKVWSKEQITTFLEKAEGAKNYALYVLALLGGFRQGELFAVEWNAIEMRENDASVQVRRTLVNLKGSLEIGEPKTEKSRRTVTLPRKAADALRAHKKAQEAKGYKGSLVFPNSRGGGYLRTENFGSREFHPLVERLKLPRIRFHDLRHCHATLLLIEGVHPKIVSERLGHSSVAFTLEIYSHVVPGIEKQATDALDRLF